MRSMRSVSTIFSLGVCLGGFSACTSALLNTPVTKKGEGWTVTLSEVKEGPDEYIGEGAVNLRANEGEKFIWAVVTVKSEQAAEQPFEYDTCTLGGGEKGIAPFVVARHPDILIPADRSEDFAPGQERTRQLIYRYPKDSVPPRMKCGAIVLAIPKPR
jgi:hypothetical protein